MIIEKGKINRMVRIVQATYAIKSTVYCELHHSAYPLDKQTCNVSMGSSSRGAVFVLVDRAHPLKGPATQLTSDFNISMTSFDLKKGGGNNQIGITIKMDRALSSFMLQYYLPCIAIVLISQMSFVIPVTAIPGRVSLLVTLFLTLVNLFIHQMVSINLVFLVIS